MNQNFLIYFACFAALTFLVLYSVLIGVGIKGELKKRRLKQETDLVVKHYEDIKNIYRTIRGWRHDYQNHIQVMSALVELGNIEDLEKYLKNLSDDLDNLYNFVKTGNVVVDSVISSKLAVCKIKNISCETELSMPENCAINDIDLCVVLSNLLDNAIEACEKVEDSENRYIHISIGVLREQLYIEVKNAIKESPKKKGDKFVSSKGDGHGFGLGRIDRTVNKYFGYVNRYFKDNTFVTEIMMPFTLK